MLTGHEKPLIEYSNPFLMFCRKYDLPERLIYQAANIIHPVNKLTDRVGAIHSVRHLILAMTRQNVQVLDDFDSIMEQLYSYHNIGYIKVADNGED